MKKFVVSLGLVLALCTTLIGCGTKEATKEETKEVAIKEQTLHLLEVAEMPSLDSSKSTDGVSFEALTNMMEGLYRLDKNNKPTPGIAESVAISDDKKTYTFKLRDAKWSNGDAVVAEDFIYAWKRALDPKFGSEYAFILYHIKNGEKINTGELALEQLGVTAPDSKTLVVELEVATPYFLELTTFPTYFPLQEKFVTGKGEQYGLEVEDLLYNGPFYLAEWKHEEGWILKKNPNYWDKDTVKLDAIDVKVVKDTSTAVNLFDTGKVDKIDISAEYIDKYKDAEEYNTVLDGRVNFIRFNQKNPIFQNKKVRQAIALAFDKQGIVDTILRDGSVAGNFIIPTLWVSDQNGVDFRDGNGKLQVTNVEEAQKIWEEAKKELGVKEVNVKLLNYDDEPRKKVGEFIRGDLAEKLPGLNIELLQVPFKDKLEREKNLDYDFSHSGWGPDYPDPMTFIDMFETKSPFNEMNYSNPKYDELVEAARTTLLTDIPARWKALQQAEKILLEEDFAIAPVYQKGVSYVEKTYVKNVYKHNFGGDYSYKWAYLEK